MRDMQKQKRFWIFQSNPDHFRIFDWWDNMKYEDHWRIDKCYRDKVREMDVDAMWVAKEGDSDIWSIRMQHHDEVLKQDIQAVFPPDKYDSWQVNQHKNEIRKGDRIAVWVAKGSAIEDTRGFYAIAEVIEDPYEILYPKDRGLTYWSEEYRSKFQETPMLLASIHYLRERFDNPVPIASIRNHPVLNELGILTFSHGTNFPVTTEEWKAIVAMMNKKWSIHVRLKKKAYAEFISKLREKGIKGKEWRDHVSKWQEEWKRNHEKK